MKKVWIVTGMTILAALLAGLGGLYGFGVDFITGLNIAETLVISALHIGICILFIMGLDIFKDAFKRAYLFICAGIILLAVAVLQYTVLGSVNALGSFWVTSGAIELAFVFSILSLLIGVALFARLMGVAHLGWFLWVTAGAALVGSVIATQIPTSRTDIDPHMMFVSSALYTFEAILLIAFVPLLFRIRKKAGSLYIPMFAWLFTAFVVYAVLLIVSVYALFVLPYDHWYMVYGVTMAFFFVAALCLFKAAIELNRIRYAEPPLWFVKFSFYGKQRDSIHKTSEGAVNAIIYLAGLPSDKTAVEPILDGLRSVTAQVAGQAGENMTHDQQKRLTKVFLELEEYLVEHEKIGNYSRKQLRERVIHKFQTPKETIFWDAIRVSGSSPAPV